MSKCVFFSCYNQITEKPICFFIISWWQHSASTVTTETEDTRWHTKRQICSTFCRSSTQLRTQTALYKIKINWGQNGSSFKLPLEAELFCGVAWTVSTAWFMHQLYFHKFNFLLQIGQVFVVSDVTVLFTVLKASEHSAHLVTSGQRPSWVYSPTGGTKKHGGNPEQSAH